MSYHDELCYTHRYRGEMPDVDAICLPAWGSKWGYSDFSHDKNIYDLSDVNDTCIYCVLNLKISPKKLHSTVAHTWAYFVCICFRVPCVVLARIQIPPIGAPWLTTPYTGWYNKKSGISLYIWAIIPQTSCPVLFHVSRIFTENRWGSTRSKGILWRQYQIHLEWNLFGISHWIPGLPRLCLLLWLRGKT